MCGIAGVLNANPFLEELDTLIYRMLGALQHRGPDDRGFYISADRQAAIAHTRLSILDLSSAGHQPMSTADGRYWITFNGEIYNFRELRSQLIAQGEQFHSQTDTEVILKLYQKIGSDCVKHLRGMFAFAIWDDWEKTCFLARDPLGIKPLYYWRSGCTLLFASELKAILATKLPPISLSSAGLYGYLIGGSVPEPHTLIDGIYCLPAGSYLHWQSGDIIQSQYWQIDFTPEKISPSEAKEKVRAALIDSLEHHFVSDVPVGIFLSGGIDSSTLLALASQTQTNKLCTYSIAFEEPEWNEGDIAKKVADRFGSHHTEYQITASLGRQLLPQFLAAIDQPTIDGFNTFCISQIARQDGTKVVLSGLGGDELFGGYQSFEKVPQMVQLGKRLKAVYPLNVGMGIVLENSVKSPQLKRLGDFWQQTPSSVNAYRCFRGIFSHWEARAIANQYIKNKIERQQEILPCFPTLKDEVSWLEINYYMRNQLLRDSDVMSMAWGLELRVPFVDRVLLETIASIPSHIRLAPSKQLLIQAVPELPDWIINRPKKGFSFPFNRWMAAEWSDFFSEVNFDKKISLKPWYRRWSLFILKYWWENISA